MNNIGTTIALLRRERGMTQESLAEFLGVSNSTISKWENNTYYPDVALMPVIADVFGVTIDALYGREDVQHSITADAAIDRAIEHIRKVVVGTIYNPEMDGPFEDQLAQYRKVMQEDARQRSVIENERDVLYFREKLGALALRKPEDGWNVLFAQEAAADLLRTLADEDFRRAMRVILQKRMLTFTIPSLMKHCGAPDAARLEKCLQDCGCFACRELEVDETPLVYYELVGGESKLFLLYAVMAFAKEFVEHQAVHYCFIGNSSYFTP